MRTPYDTALRSRQREVDDLRVSIGTATDRLMQVEALCESTSEAIQSETSLASSDWMFSPEAYFARARAERTRLAKAQREASAQLEALQEQAKASYGSMRAMENAAGVFRKQAERAAASAEQAAMDDLANARFFRTMNSARRLAGGTT